MFPLITGLRGALLRCALITPGGYSARACQISTAAIPLCICGTLSPVLGAAWAPGWATGLVGSYSANSAPPLVGPTRGRAATHSGPLGGRHQLKLRLAHSACSINSTALPLSTWLLRPVCVPRRVPAVPTAPCRPTWPCWGGLYRTSSTASGILQSTASDPNGSRIFTVRLIVSTATVHPRRGSSRPANAIRYHVGVGAGRLRHHFMGLRAW